MTCWPGFSAFDTSAPTARSRTRGNESFDNAEMHIRFEQGEAHFAHGRIHIRFGEFAAAAELVKDLVKSSSKGFKHKIKMLPEVGDSILACSRLRVKQETRRFISDFRVSRN